MPSRSARSEMVANSPDSSIRFQRKARASALTSVLSVLRGALRQLHLLAAAALHEAERDVHCYRFRDWLRAGHAAVPRSTIISISRASPAGKGSSRSGSGRIGASRASASVISLSCVRAAFHVPATISGWRNWIIKLPPNVAEDSRTIVVNLLLDALDRYLNGLVDAEMSPDGSRGLRILCMIDEAHQIPGTRLPSLSRLIRMSPSKGGAVMLVSQSPDDFSGEDDEFLDNTGPVAAFKTNARPGAAARVPGKEAKLTNLQPGQCFVRFDGTTRKIKAW